MVKHGPADHEALPVEQDAGDDGAVISTHEVVRLLRELVCSLIEFLDLLENLRLAALRQMDDRGSAQRRPLLNQAFAMFQLLSCDKNRIRIDVVPGGADLAHPAGRLGAIDK